MLQEQVIIVTGGATGIGKGIGEVLAEEGARVAIVQPELQQAQEAAADLEDSEGFAADIGDPAQVEQMVRDVAARFGRIDGLVNNAALTGLPAVSAFATASAEHVNRVVDVNLKGTIWCSQAVARWLLANRRPGGIVHIASVGAFAAQEMASIYCATKAALVSLAQSMALELAPHGIRVNAVAPGDIRTEASADILDELRAMGATGRYWRNTPAGRRGTPAEIGEAVAFLLSEKATFITGATLRVDGGFLAY